MELLYFTDISQVHYVVDCVPELLEQKHAMTGDIVVAYELERLGIEFIDEWDLIGPEDIERNFETARLLSKSWWDENLASTKYEGFALSDTAQQDLIYPLEASLNAKTVYHRLFSSYQIESITGFFLPPVGVFRTGPIPANRAVRSVAQAVLFYLAEKREIPVVKLESGHLLSSGAIAPKVHALGEIKASKVAKTGEAADKSVLVYEDGMYPDEFAVLMETLNKLPGIIAISISQKVLELGKQPSDEKSGAGYRIQHFWNAFIESVGSYSGIYPEIFGNPHLQFQFECIRNEMLTAVEYGNVYAAVLDILKPALVVFGHEAFTRERTFVRLANSRGITSAGLMHGVAKHRFTYRGIVGDVDLVMAANDTDIEGLATHGIERARLNKVGCLRYEEIHYKNAGGVSFVPAMEKKAAKERLGLDPTKPLIVWTTAAINAGFASPIAAPRKHREAIREFLALVRSRSDLQFVIKAHPSYDYYEIYRRLLEHKLPNLTFPEQVSLSELVNASDIFLMINYCTTAALEAMVSRVPVVYMDNAIYPLEDRQDNLSATGMHRVQSILEMEKYIDELLTDPKANSQALALADEGLERFLEIDGSQASSKLYGFMNHVLSDQQANNTAELPNTQRMHELLLSLENKQTLPCEYFSEIAKNHSVEHLMFVFAYLAGLNNFMFTSLSRVFDAISLHYVDMTEVSWKTAQWEYLPTFITGKINSTNGSSGRLAIIWLFRQYLLSPHKFASAPASFKRNVISYAVKAILGRTGISLLNWILKRPYHLRMHQTKSR